MAEVGTAFLTIIPSARGFGAKLNGQIGGEVSSAGSSQGSRFGSAFSGAAAKYAKAGLLGLGALGAAGAAVGLKTAAGMEQAEIAFTTMLGSAKKADTFIRDLGAFAAKTPFAFPELQTAASSLISAGVETSKVIPIMTTLGDVTSGMGTGSEGVKRATVAIQQMNAAGRITGEDLNQLRDAGIPVYDLLAAATGKSKEEVTKLAQAGKLGKTELDAMMKALETGKGLEKFNGLMEKQSKSLTGMISTLADTVNMKLAEFITPALPAIKKGIGALTEFVGPALDGVANAFKALVAGVLVVKGAFDSAFGQMKQHETTTKIIAGVITTLLVPAFVAWGVSATRAAAMNTAAWVTGKAQAISSAATQLLYMTLLGLGWIGVGVRAVAGAAVQVGAWLAAKLGAVTTVAAYVVAFAVMVAGWVASAAAAVINAAIIAASWLIAFWPVALVVAIVAAAVFLIIKYWDEIVAAAKALGKEISQEWNTFKEKVAEVWDAIKQKVSDAWDGIKSTVVTKVAELVAFVKELPGKIRTALSDAATWLVGVGEDIITGLGTGIKNSWEWVKGIITDLGGNIVQWAKDALHIGSPSKLMADEVGRWIPAGIAVGIDAHAGDVRSSMAGLTADLSATAHLGLRAGRSVSGPTASAATARELHLRSGALEIVNGKAYITGVISEELLAVTG